MTAEILHSIYIAITIAISFLVTMTPLAAYNLQIGALLLVILYGGKLFIFPKQTHRLFESLIYIFIITLIVGTTGSLHSAYFFLLYFLLFTLSLFLEPVIAVTTTVTYIVFFVLTTQIQDIQQLIPLVSLLIITPFALFLGQEFIRNVRLQKTASSNKESELLFLSLVLKNHVQTIIEAAENYTGDHHLDIIRKNARRLNELIDEYERNSSTSGWEV